MPPPPSLYSTFGTGLCKLQACHCSSCRLCNSNYALSLPTLFAICPRRDPSASSRCSLLTVSNLFQPLLCWPCSLSLSLLGVLYSLCPNEIDLFSIGRVPSTSRCSQLVVFPLPRVSVCLQPMLQTCPLYNDFRNDICNPNDI